MRQDFHLCSRGPALAALIAAMFLAVPSSQAQEQAVQTMVQSIADPYRPVVHNYTDAKLSEPINVSELAFEVRDPQQELLGATLAPLSDALRTQLNVAAGQGVVVASLRNGGPSAQAGLKLHDVLLSLADKPLASADDLSKHLKAAGESPVGLKLLRGGKQIAIQVRPIYRVTLGPVVEEQKKYFLGISLGGLDEALRSQLGLPADEGVVITDVNKNSPAEAAGIKVHDIVLELGGKLIDTPDKLAALVQAGQDKPQTIKLLRTGKPLTMNVTAEIRNVENIEGLYDQERWIRILNVAAAEKEVAAFAKERESAAKLSLKKEAAASKRIEDLERQVRSLREALDQIKSSNSPKK